MFRHRDDPRYFEWTRAALAVGVVGLLVAHELWPSRITVSTEVLGLVALLVVLVALPLIEELTLPGGVSAKMRQQLREAEESITRLRETDERADGEEPRPSDDAPVLEYLGRLAEQQPEAGLIALRAELHDQLRDTYEELYEKPAPGSVLETLRRLLRDDHLDADQADVAIRLLEIGNQAAHAHGVRPHEAEQAVAYGQTLVSSIRQRAIDSPRDFEEQVLDRLKAVAGAGIDHRVLIRDSNTAEFEADFIVRVGGRRYVVEARHLRSLKHREANLRHAEMIDRAAIASGEADAGLIVVPDGLGIEPYDLDERIRVVPLKSIANTLTDDWPAS